MRIINIYWKTCSVAIAGPLAEIEHKYLQRGVGNQALRVNRFSVVTGENRERLIISLEEGEFKNHDDSKKFQGCCGSSGLDGLNKLCINNHEVATEFSDCLMTHYIEFDLQKVIVKQKIDDDYYEEIII